MKYSRGHSLKLEFHMNFKPIIVIVLISFCVFLFSNNHNKQTLLTLNCEESIALALKNNLGMKSKMLSLEQKKWALYTSWNEFLPDMSLGFNMSIYNEAAVDYEVEQQKDSEEKLSDSLKDIYSLFGEKPPAIPSDEEIRKNIRKGSVTFLFDLNYKLQAGMFFNIFSTINQYRQGKISLELAKKLLKKTVSKHYYQIILALQNLELLKYKLDVAEQRYTYVVKKFKDGLVSELDKINIEYEYEYLKPKWMQANNKYDALVNTFKQLLGIKKDIEIQITDNLNDRIEQLQSIISDISKQYPQYIDDNLELKLNHLQRDNAVNKRNMAIAGLTPGFNLSFIMDPTYTKKDPYGKNRYWFDDFDNEWKQNNGALSLYFSLSLSALIPFSREQMRIVTANIEIARKKYQIEELKQKKILELNNLLTEIEQNFSMLKPMQLNINIAEKAYNLTDIMYKTGKKAFLDLKEAENKQTEANLDMLNIKYNLLDLLVELEFLLNNNGQ